MSRDHDDPSYRRGYEDGKFDLGLSLHQAQVREQAQEEQRRADAEARAKGWGPRTKLSDPAYKLLIDDFTSKPAVHRDGCYICEDPEFAQMGLPLCAACPECRREGRGDGHVAADDSVCDDCGYDMDIE